MQSGQRNAGACKSSLEERRRRLTEGWMDGGREEGKEGRREETEGGGERRLESV